MILVCSIIFYLEK